MTSTTAPDTKTAPAAERVERTLSAFRAAGLEAH
jgi:hypothetical protein